MEEKDKSREKVSLEQIKGLLEILLPIPRPYIFVLGLAIFLSLFQITRNPQGAVTVTFGLTNITAVLLALIWLPFLLKVIALSGGGFKTMAGEASLTGLLGLLSNLDPETQREALSTTLGVLEAAEPKLPQTERTRLQEIKQGLETQLASLPPETQKARQQLLNFARLYEALREDMPWSAARTFRMETLMAQARTLAKQSGYTLLEISEIYARQTEGDRVIALALVQANPDARFFELVLDSIDHSESGFEQYHALVAMERMLPLLDPEQKKMLIDSLNDQRSGGQYKCITPDDPDRWTLSNRLLQELR